MVASCNTFDIDEAVRKVLPYMMEMREHFHAHPELSDQEFDTCKKIFKELTLMGVENARIMSGTGVTGIITGKLPGPVILLRADIDALPLTEKTHCPYASLVDGVMHACGHDGHAANLLGVAKVLTQHRDSLHGTIRLAFQPAEEGNGGAARMIDDGILLDPKVDYAIGLHVAGGLPKGTVSIKKGPVNASCDDFTITLHGKGGHGAQLAHCVSPIQMGVDSIQAIQNLVYNIRQDGDGIVLSFGQFQGGASPNVIPDTAVLKGTLRTYNERKRQLILQRIHSILEAITTSYGGNFELTIIPFSPVCINDDALTDKITTILKETCPKISFIPQDRGAGSEDFAYFSAAVPGVFYTVGVNSGTVQLHHSPSFHWDSAALKYMCKTMVEIVYNFTDF